jgi:hypothetical protein
MDVLIMILPDKEYLRIEEVAARLSNASGIPVRDVDIFDYIKQGILPAYIFYKKEYYLVPNSELMSLDEYLRDRSVGHIRFPKCSFVPPGPSLFDETVTAKDVLVSAQNVYVKQKDLTEFEEIASNKKSTSNHDDGNVITNSEKPFGAVERKSLHLMIVALVELAELNNEKDYTIASNISCKVKLVENTVVKYLRAAYETKRKQEEANKR